MFAQEPTFEVLDLMQELELAGFPDAHYLALAYFDYIATLQFITSEACYVNPEVRNVWALGEGVARLMPGALSKSLA